MRVKSKSAVLHMLLGSPNYISGQELANRLGVSRQTVGKCVQQLREEGYKIEATQRLGYKFLGDNNLVTAEVLTPRLHCPLEPIYYATVDSTNTEAKRQAMAGAREGLVVLAEAKRLLNAGYRGNFLVVADEQTAGRGRQGKQFYSPRGTGIYMTVVVHHGRRLQDAVSVTTAAGVAVCRAIEELTDKHPQIKWVNDVYIDDKKICGILTEAVVGMESGLAEAMIIGIGANMQTEEFPPEVENAASLDADVSRADMIAAIADHLWEILDDGYESYIDYYRSHSMLLGKAITFIRDGVTTPATAIGIDEIGGLVVRLEDGSVITLRSGEITVRPRCTKKS